MHGRPARVLNLWVVRLIRRILRAPERSANSVLAPPASPATAMLVGALGVKPIQFTVFGAVKRPGVVESTRIPASNSSRARQ
jgi:hypothetical protein